jgi:zinc finger protein
MSAEDERTHVTQGPSEFFESIGNKVQNLTSGEDGAATTDGDDDFRPVEEIESLCMNCGKNVRISPPQRM